MGDRSRLQSTLSLATTIYLGGGATLGGATLGRANLPSNTWRHSLDLLIITACLAWLRTLCVCPRVPPNRVLGPAPPILYAGFKL